MTINGLNWRALLREPLVHFLVAGALIFALLFGRPPDAGERRIAVNEAVVTRLVDRWAQAFRRQPSPSEMDGLIRDYVRDQVYYREALRLGLDRDDEVVIKRMRNKLVAMASGDAEANEPSDAQLQALIDANPGRYTGESHYALTQVYLGGDATAAPAVLAKLRGGADPAGLGAPAPLPQHFADTPRSEITERFGEDFPAVLDRLQVGAWSGPVASGLGQHIVRLEQRDAGPPPRLADLRQRLTNDWRAAARAAAEEEDYQRLLQGYAVTIERPKS
jgi:peptidyl-prolyl cis-trans isomerase C